MGKMADNSVLDAPLDFLANNTERAVVCSAEPANFAGVAAVALADYAVIPGDFTKADGDVSGRKTTLAAKAAVPVDTGGTATHLALVDDTNSILRYVSTTASQAISGGGGTVDVGALEVEFRDPT